MKIYFVLATLLILMACNDSKNASDLARQTVLDSVRSVNLANDVKLETIDSMNKVNANIHHQGTRQSANVQSAPVNTTTAEKKKMSNAKKGTLIGAGAGIVGGAIVGAATSKDKGKGAVIGGIIGGAVGAGAGYEIGKNKDNKRDTIK